MRSFPFAFLPCPPRFGLAALAVVTLTTATATASTLWHWGYSGSGITASGTFTTVDSPDGNGGYLIVGITGTRNGETITGLQAPGTSIPGNEPYTVDDLVFPGPGPQLTKDGFGFSTADGNYANPFYADFLATPGYLEFFSTPPFTVGSPGSEDTELPVQFSATPVSTPEPATYALVLGALALVWLRRVLDDRCFRSTPVFSPEPASSIGMAVPVSLLGASNRSDAMRIYRRLKVRSQHRSTLRDLNEVPSAFGSGHGFFAACYSPQGDSPFTHAELGYRKLPTSR